MDANGTSASFWRPPYRTSATSNADLLWSSVEADPALRAENYADVGIPSRIPPDKHTVRRGAPHDACATERVGGRTLTPLPQRTHIAATPFAPFQIGNCRQHPSRAARILERSCPEPRRLRSVDSEPIWESVRGSLRATAFENDSLSTRAFRPRCFRRPSLARSRRPPRHSRGCRSP